jgi:hypothetical protein
VGQDGEEGAGDSGAGSRIISANRKIRLRRKAAASQRITDFSRGKSSGSIDANDLLERKKWL